MESLTIETLYDYFMERRVPPSQEGMLLAFRTGLDLGLRRGLELGEPPDWAEFPPPPGGPAG